MSASIGGRLRVAKCTEHNKLVRDRIPEIIRESGGQPSTYALDDKARQLALLDKLLEEARELRDAVVSGADVIGERADVAEVLRALDDELDLTPVAIEEARRDKADARGGFKKGIFLEYVDEE